MVTVTSFNTPNGVLVPAIAGTRFAASWTNTAVFDPGTGTCAPGEYRQYIKGSYIVNGSPIVHVLCGPIIVLPNAYLEDSCPPPGCTAYGYRVCPDHPYNSYTPNRAAGCNYSMYDAPGFNNVQSGNTYRLDLGFRGTLIDTSRAGAVLRQADWSVQGATTMSEIVTRGAAAALAPTDRVVGAHIVANLDTRTPELHVVIVRAAGQPRLDPAQIILSALDGDGHPVALSGPAVHEVGGVVRATASLVFAIESGVPAMIELSIGPGLITLPVRAR